MNEAFLLLTLSPLPVWVGLILFPKAKWTRLISSPFVFPPLLGVAYLFLFWKVWHLGIPSVPETEVKSVRVFVGHPFVFLLLWAHLQMANLFVGTVLLQDAGRNRLSIPLELALCWIFAPVAVLIYTIRRFIRRKIFSRFE